MWRLRELSSIITQTFSFVSEEKQGYWSLEWKQASCTPWDLTFHLSGPSTTSFQLLQYCLRKLWTLQDKLPKTAKQSSPSLDLLYLQGRNQICIFVTDPIFLPKILIPDPKNDENFDPWTRKNLIPDPSFQEKYCWSRSHALWFQIPELWSLIPALFRPLINDPICLVTTLLNMTLMSTI